jgi:hypothetical protein
LAHSRQALLEQMRIGSTAHTPTDRAPNDGGKDGLWSWLMQACQNHPGLLALQALAPLLRERMRHHPWQVLALSGLLGGALVLLRPWRLLPTGALLMTAARAVPLGQLLSAWLHRAHHEPANEPANKRSQKQGGNQGSKRSD